MDVEMLSGWLNVAEAFFQISFEKTKVVPVRKIVKHVAHDAQRLNSAAAEGGPLQ